MPAAPRTAKQVRSNQRGISIRDARKVAVALVLWERTRVSQNWIAARLQMGSAANVSQQLRRRKSAPTTPSLSSALRAFTLSVKN